MEPVSEAMESARAWCKDALKYIGERGLAPTPANYAVWYAYAAGSHPALSRELDRMVGEGLAVTATETAELHERFLADGAEHDVIADVSTRMDQTIQALMENVGLAEKGARNYGHTLNAMAGELADTDGANLAGMVASLLAETNRMTDINRTLEGRLGQATAEVAQLRADLAKTNEDALTDGLTQIANRRAFDRALKQQVLEAITETKTFGLLMLDIDLFKNFNDTHGHSTGDQVLKLVAKGVEQVIGAAGLVARIGGEEFGVLLPGKDLTAALALAERVRHTVGNKVLKNRKTNQELGTITLSVGAATFIIGEDGNRLVDRADEALYLAKHLGRNRVCSERDLPLAARMTNAG